MERLIVDVRDDTSEKRVHTHMQIPSEAEQRARIISVDWNSYLIFFYMRLNSKTRACNLRVH